MMFSARCLAPRVAATCGRCAYTAACSAFYAYRCCVGAAAAPIRACSPVCAARRRCLANVVVVTARARNATATIEDDARTSFPHHRLRAAQRAAPPHRAPLPGAARADCAVVACVVVLRVPAPLLSSAAAADDACACRCLLSRRRRPPTHFRVRGVRGGAAHHNVVQSPCVGSRRAALVRRQPLRLRSGLVRASA